jgi:5-methylcytosine-specific restriction endonuclease McrA
MRRYGGLKPSAGTRIPTDMRTRVLTRDQRATGGCVGFGRLPGECEYALELDHVRASGALGMKSVTCDCNLVALCGAHHKHKTFNGRDGRRVLLAYLEQFAYGPHVEGHVA